MKQLLSKFKTHKLGFIAVTFVALFALSATSSLFVSSQNAYAGGAVGDAGTAGGSCSGKSNCPHTNNGYGWYKYSISGSGPHAFKGGGSWSNVQTACNNVKAQSAVMFIILTPTDSVHDAWVYLYDSSDYYGYADYRGDDGGNWMTFSQAHNEFNAIKPADRAGYTWDNNVAWFCSDYRNEWSFNGQSYLQVASNASVGANRDAAGQGSHTATPGNRLYWFLDLRNTGPDDATENIKIYNGKSGFSNGWNGNTQVDTWGTPSYDSLYKLYATGGNNSSYTIYDVTQDDVGNTLCERIVWKPRKWDDANTDASKYRCAYIPYNYSLSPTITNVTNGSVVEGATGAYPVTGAVTNNSGTTKSHTGINYEITELIYAPGAGLPGSGGKSASAPCTFFTGESKCTSVNTGGTGDGYIGKGSSVGLSGNGDITTYAVGTRVCYAMSVKRNSSGNTDWKHSSLYCLVIGKKPKVQVLGGDLIVGRATSNLAARTSNVNTSVSRQSDGKYFGSYVEYAITSTGIVTGMASGSGYAGGVMTNVSSDYCGVSYLTFTSAGASTCSSSTTLGEYKYGSVKAPNVSSRFTTSSSTPNLPSTSPNLTANNLSGLYKSAATSVNVSSSAEIPAGRSIIINAPNATVTISTNINYTSGLLTSISQIPQVVIIANNIVIADGVTNVDAWLIATGTGTNGRLNTCGAGGVSKSTALTSKICNQRLTVNGAILANHLILRRTAGADAGASAGQPAEVFNLRADAYIWASSYSPGTGRLPTVTQNELPPRF